MTRSPATKTQPLKLDFAPVPGASGVQLADIGGLARQLEDAGYDSMWTVDASHDPFLPHVAAAAATERLMLGTAIATAFTRSPMVTAMTAWDLQRLSAGRFVLGLGTQVKGHNERRFSVPWDSPGPRLRELVLALRHIWGAFQGDHPLSFHGRFYTHDLITPYFDPGPIDDPSIPIYLAAVNPYMYRVCGEVADGVHVHPLHSLRYLDEVALPALGLGLERSERTRNDVTLVASVFVLVGSDPAAERVARQQLAFYGSTLAYRPVLELHGWGDLRERVRGHIGVGDLDAAGREVTDAMLAEFVVAAPTWPEAFKQVRERYAGVIDHIVIYGIEKSGFVPTLEVPRLASEWFADSAAPAS